MAILSNINDKFAVDSSGGIQFSGQTGTAGYVLKSNGNAAPTWVDGSTVIGGPYLPLSGGTLTGATATASGISFTVGGVLTGQANSNTFGTASASGRALIVQSGSSNQAIMLKNNLGGDGTISATGTATTMNYSFGTYSVAPALFIQNDGKIGIGTDAPSTKLTISGVQELLQLTRGGASDTKWFFSADSTRLFIAENTSATANIKLTINENGNVGIGASAPSAKLEVAGGSSGIKLSNLGDQSAYDGVRISYTGYNSGSPDVNFTPTTTPGSGNADTYFRFLNSNGSSATSNNRANVSIDGVLDIGRNKYLGETQFRMRNYDATIVDAGEVQNAIIMSGLYYSGSGSQLVETRIESVHQESNGNGGSKLQFSTQTGGSTPVVQMQIDKVGNVGIGVVPTQKLDVNGLVKHLGLDMTAGVQVDQTTSYTKTLTGTANTWRPTGIDNNDIGNSGSYLVQVFSDDHSGAGPANYSWYWTGTMSWYVGGTNNNVTSELYLQGCGHHTNMVLELRTKVNFNNAAIPYAELEWKSATSFVNSPNWIFKFRRLI